MSGTTLADLPDVNDLVDVTLDSRTEPLAAVIGAVTGDIVLLGDPMDRTGHLVIPEPAEQGLLVWGSGSALRQATIEVLSTNRRPAPTWLVRLTAPSVRCQRRSFVRANVNLPVAVRQPDSDFEVTALDLSEGGMRCYTHAEVALKAGDSVVAEFSPGQSLATSATVVRTKRGNDEQPTELGLWFTGLNMIDADIIRRYVFRRLLEQRRRGEA